MSHLTLLILYLILSVLFSFICSILEAVLLSVTPTFLEVQKKKKASFATGLAKLKADVDTPLIAILTLNTLAHTVGAISVGSEAEKAFGNGEMLFGVIPMVTLVSVVMTILILVVSEIIPKTIGATYWRSLAGISTRVLNWMIFPLRYTGILFLLKTITNFFGHGGGHGESAFNRTAFSVMAERGADEGHLDENESQIILNLLNFKRVEAQHVMTPRTVVIAADENTTVSEFYATHPNLRFSRIPIYNEQIDNITGFVMRTDILKAMIDDKTEASGNSFLKQLARPILTINMNQSLPKAFDKLLENRAHIAMLTSEFGGFEGIVTQEDILETLLGQEIMDETDNTEDMRKLAQKKWQERAKSRGLIDGNEE